MRLTIRNLLIIGFLASLIVAGTLAAMAINKYPGSTADANGFNFISDYWCDLFKQQTPSGISNPAMLFAKLATITAAFSFACFCIAVPIKFIDNKGERLLSQLLAVFAVSIGSFLFTGYHDKVILIASVLEFFAIALLLKSLKQKQEYKLFYLGILAIGLLVCCNALVYVPDGYGILAFTQKLSCGVMISWMLLLTKGAWQEATSL